MKNERKRLISFWFTVYSLFGVWKIVQTLEVILFEIIFFFSFFFSFFHFRKTTPQCLAEMCNVRDAPVAPVVRENSTKDRKAVQSLIALCKQVQQCFQAFELLPICQVLASNNLTRTCDLLRDHFIDIVS